MGDADLFFSLVCRLFPCRRRVLSSQGTSPVKNKMLTSGDDFKLVPISVSDSLLYFVRSAQNIIVFIVYFPNSAVATWKKQQNFSKRTYQKVLITHMYTYNISNEMYCFIQHNTTGFVFDKVMNFGRTLNLCMFNILGIVQELK